MAVPYRASAARTAQRSAWPDRAPRAPRRTAGRRTAGLRTAGLRPAGPANAPPHVGQRPPVRPAPVPPACGVRRPAPRMTAPQARRVRPCPTSRRQTPDGRRRQQQAEPPRRQRPSARSGHASHDGIASARGQDSAQPEARGQEGRAVQHERQGRSVRRCVAVPPIPRGWCAPAASARVVGVQREEGPPREDRRPSSHASPCANAGVPRARRRRSGVMGFPSARAPCTARRQTKPQETRLPRSRPRAAAGVPPRADVGALPTPRGSAQS